MEKQSQSTFAESTRQKNGTDRFAKNQPSLTICISNRQNDKKIKYFDFTSEISESDVHRSAKSDKDEFALYSSDSQHKFSVNSTASVLDVTAQCSINNDKSKDSFYTLLLYLDRILSLDEIAGNLKKLERAIILKSIDEFIAIANNCLEISSKCGMFQGVKPLRRLIELKATRNLADAEILYQQIKNEYGNSKFMLSINLRQIETYLQKKTAN